MDEASNKNKLLKSPVLWGVIGLLAANLLLGFVQPLAKVDPESLPSARTWVWWAMHELLEKPRNPEVVLLGSSLVMHPISRQDADYLNRDFDYVHHHRSCYMADRLSQKLGLPGLDCYNFSLPGAVTSDDYLIARALFSSERSPRLIVLCLTMRDFNDHGVPCAAATAAFRYLRRFTNIDDIVDIAMPQIWQRSDYWIGKVLYLWDKKLDMQAILAERSKQLCKPLVGKVCRQGGLNELDLGRNMPINLRSEVEEGTSIVTPHIPYSFEDNTREFRKRYRPNDGLFVTEVEFLDRFMRLCQEQGSEVVLVNMPLTKENMALMPPRAYDKYLSMLKAKSRQWNCVLLNLNQSPAFQKTDFHDTVHMTASGGKKMVDAIVSVIAGDRSLASALTGPAQAGTRIANRSRSTK